MIDLLRELFSALGRNKLRTVLTGCSVTVGMFLLIVLLGASNGVIHAFMANAGGLRLDVVNVYNGTTSKVWQGMQANRSIQLDDRDHNLLPRRFEEQVMQANRVVEQSAKVRFRNETASMSVRGVTAEYLQTNPLKLLAGRFVNPLDERDRRKSIVVSSKVLEQLKLNQPASAVVGQVLEVDSLCFRIVGVFADRENERQLYGYIPFSTARLLQKKGSRYDFLELKTQGVSDDSASERFARGVRRASGAVHRFAPDDQGALFIYNEARNAAGVNKSMDVLHTATWIIGLLTLLGGVVSVSNIMLITVRERTREFGIRRALGARPLAILREVMLESVLITAFFGYMGIFLGVLATEWLDASYGRQVVDMGVGQGVVFLNPTVDMRIALQALVVLIVAGLVAGYYPARKAIRARVVDALKG
jgi:putative ABC transport system permease protein